MIAGKRSTNRETLGTTCLAAEAFESLSARPSRLLSPIPLGSLSPAGRRALLSRTPTQRLPEELRLQQEIETMQREIDELATSIKRRKLKRGLNVDFHDSGSDGSHFGYPTVSSATSAAPVISATLARPVASASLTSEPRVKSARQSMEPAVMSIAAADRYSEPNRLPNSRVNARHGGDNSLRPCSQTVDWPYSEVSDVVASTTEKLKRSSAMDSSRNS